MKLEIGRVVYSRAGRDRGEFLAITDFDRQTVTVCNGKDRPLERPKRKNLKHIGLTTTVLDNGSMSTNRSLRRALRAFAGNAGDEGCEED